MDADWKAVRDYTPWVKKLPSEYIRGHIRFGSQPMEQHRRAPISTPFCSGCGRTNSGVRQRIIRTGTGMIPRRYCRHRRRSAAPHLRRNRLRDVRARRQIVTGARTCTRRHGPWRHEVAVPTVRRRLSTAFDCTRMPRYVVATVARFHRRAAASAVRRTWRDRRVQRGRQLLRLAQPLPAQGRPLCQGACDRTWWRTPCTGCNRSARARS